jgi:hypothetical protein
MHTVVLLRRLPNYIKIRQPFRQELNSDLSPYHSLGIPNSVKMLQVTVILT